MPPTKPAAPVSSTCLEVGEPVRLAISGGLVRRVKFPPRAHARAGAAGARRGGGDESRSKKKEEARQKRIDKERRISHM